MADNTPPYNTVGKYELLAPFTIDKDTIYVCEAIDGFEALEYQQVNVYEKYYKPKGLTEEVFRKDRDNSINIITLMAEGGSVIYVPSSYIKSFPNARSVPYNHTFATFDLGVLPDGLDIKASLEHAKTVLNNAIGVKATYHIQVLPTTGLIDLTKHQQLETSRLATIKYQSNPIAQNTALLKENGELRERIGLLEEALDTK